MCGIFGIIQNQRINPANLTSVSSILSHRGPDDEGYLLINSENKDTIQAKGNDTPKGIAYPDVMSITSGFNAAFLHRRLSIIDLSNAGHQPLSYENTRLWIVFNGEIYNYIEIKEELHNKGYLFNTNTDTEVILAAYIEWGQDCVNKFNGIWAFAIYDKTENHFFLSRDRVGVKPLYYYNKNNIFIFSSEIKAIRKYLQNQLPLNKDKIVEYLTLGQIFVGNDENTFFKDVKQISPGNNLIYKNEILKFSKYWNLNMIPNKFSPEDNVDKFKELFEQSIRLQFRSDVEVGSCLSGGIDSSSIVSLASSLFEKQLHTFSAIWPGENIDESFFIEKVNTQYKCKSHAFEPNINNIFDLIDKELWHLETPLSGASLLAQWAVFESIKKNSIKVVLDGEGSDEILAGYPKYIITYLNELIYSFKWLEIIKHHKNLQDNGYSLFSILRLQKDKLILNKFNIRFQDFPLKYTTLKDFLIQDITKYALPTLLQDKDRNSMAHSVEARVPFLDHNLIEFAISIPVEQKIHGANTKVILKEAMRNILPKEIYQRTDKIGFATPIEKRLFFPGSEHFETITQLVKNTELTDIIRTEKFDLNKTFNYRKDFCMYNLARFLQIWS